MNENLYNKLKRKDPCRLEDDDKEALLAIFRQTKDPLVRNAIAIILSDAQYAIAIPHIIAKIEDADLYDANGTLVFALLGFDTTPYFMNIVKIACEHSYEARLSALEIIERDLPAISNTVKSSALDYVRAYRQNESLLAALPDGNGAWPFIVAVEEMLLDSLAT